MKKRNKMYIILICLLAISFVFIICFLFVKSCSDKKETSDNLITTTLKKEKFYKVSFIDEDGTLYSEINVKENSKVLQPINPSKENFKFSGWLLDGIEYDFELLVNKDFTLIASWEKLDANIKQYKIEFITNGGNMIEEQFVEEGNCMIKPNDPEKKGYKFVEWQKDNKKYNFNEGVYSDLILIAIWEKVDVNIKTSSTSLKTTNKTSTTKVISNKTNSSTTSIVTSTSLKTTVAISYNVIFDSDGGSEVEEQVIKSGNKVIKPKDPIKEDYEFVGWVLNNDIYDFDKIVNSDITLVAKWKKVNFKRGDIVSIGNEEFYVISVSDATGGDKRISLFAKYTLGPDYRQSSENHTVAFSDNKGWSIGYKYINIYDYPGPTRTYVTEYKNYLNNITNNKIINVTLISKDDINSLGCTPTSTGGGKYAYITLKGQTYWTSTSLKNSSDISVINGTSCAGVGSYAISYRSSAGVRPVVSIYLSNLVNL